jgi:hypothetical protein
MVKKVLQKVTVHPPPGRPSWSAEDNLPLIYLGWGRRDFAKNPLPVHYDRGTSYYIVLSGEIVLSTDKIQKTLKGPTAIFIDSDCPYGISQKKVKTLASLFGSGRTTPPFLTFKLATTAFFICNSRRLLSRL